MKIAIYKFIGYERVSLYRRLQERRAMHFNAHELLQSKRKIQQRGKEYKSAWKQLKKKREKRRILNKTYSS